MDHIQVAFTEKICIVSGVHRSLIVIKSLTQTGRTGKGAMELRPIVDITYGIGKESISRVMGKGLLCSLVIFAKGSKWVDHFVGESPSAFHIPIASCGSWYN